MGIDYVRERIELLRRISKDREAVESGKFWTLDPRSIRFRYGESLAELKVPYHLGVEDEAAIGAAVKGIVDLIKMRYEADEKKDAGAAMHGTESLRDETYRTDVLRDGTVEKRLAQGALRISPLLDGALLAVWLQGDGPGKRFAAWVEKVFEKCLMEEATSDDGEKTSYLALLAMIKAVRDRKEDVKKIRVKGLSYERLDVMLSFTLYVAVKTAMCSLFDRLRSEGAHYLDEHSEALLRSALVPVSFLSIPSTLLSSSVNPYGISREVFDAIAKTAPGAEEAADDEEFVRESAGKVKKVKALVVAVKAQYRVVALKDLAVEFLMDFDLPGEGVCKELRNLYQDERRVMAMVMDPKQLDALHKSLSEHKEAMNKDRRRVEGVDGLLSLIESFKKGSGWFGGGDETTRSIRAMLESYYTVAMDNHIEKYAGHMRVYMTDRRKEFDDKMLFEEYGLGRLYRFSIDDRPVLTLRAKEEEGQLFVDMKDFTKKTLKVKEAAMAEFMKENFYSPIIAAASRYSVGSGMYETSGGIRLNSLPGDAAIFSGGIKNLVSLANDILRVIHNYRDKLVKRLPPVKDEVLLEDVNKRHEEARAKIKAKREELDKAVEEGQKEAEKLLVKLTEEEHRVENTYRDDLEAAIASEMEAGLFITFGPKAETMVVESADEFGGRVKVAIGEKINEAARGTDRNSAVRVKLEMLLEKARARRKSQSLIYPFDVYIDKTYNVRMPPEIDSAIERVIARKGDKIKSMAEVVANEFYQDLTALSKGRSFASLRLLSSSTNIYNRGRAITGEALEAYVRESKGTRFFFRKVVKAEELAPAIRNAFFFPAPTIEFWFGVEKKGGADDVEGFARIKDIVFKGFETARPTSVYEMIDDNGEFFRSLMKHHFEGWHGAAREASEQR